MIRLLINAGAGSFVHRGPEHLVMAFQTLHVAGRLNYGLKQIEKRRRAIGLCVERIQRRPLHLIGVHKWADPLALEIRALPTVADGGQDFAPTGFRPQHENYHAPAVAAWLV